MATKAVLFDMFDTLMLIEKDHAFYSPAVKSMHQYLCQNGIQVPFSTFRDAYIKARDALYEEADKNMTEPHFNVRVKNALLNLGYKEEAESNIVQGATDAFSEAFKKYVRIDAQATDALKQLQLKYRLGVVSNFAIPECITQLLQQHGLDRLFEIVVVSAAVNRRKPHPGIFQHALETLQVSPLEAVFVGDTVEADIRGAQTVGMKTVYIDRRPQKELETTKPDLTIKALSELPTAIAKA